jgi:hypothetical protein
MTSDGISVALDVGAGDGTPDAVGADVFRIGASVGTRVGINVTGVVVVTFTGEVVGTSVILVELFDIAGLADGETVCAIDILHIHDNSSNIIQHRTKIQLVLHPNVESRTSVIVASTILCTTASSFVFRSVQLCSWCYN